MRRCLRRLQAFEPAGTGRTQWNKEDIAAQVRRTKGGRSESERFRSGAGAMEVAQLRAEKNEIRLKKNLSCDGLTLANTPETQAAAQRRDERLQVLGAGDPTAPNAPPAQKMSWQPSVAQRAADAVKSSARDATRFDRRDPYGFQSLWPFVRNSGVFVLLMAALNQVLASVAAPSTMSRSRRPEPIARHDPTSGPSPLPPVEPDTRGRFAAQYRREPHQS